MSDEISDEKVKSSICPAMGVCHLETGVQVIIPMQMGPEKIVESLEAIMNAVKSNTAEGIGCYPIATNALCRIAFYGIHDSFQ